MISLPGRGRNARDEADILFAFREWLKAQEGRVGKLSLRTEADGSLDDDTIARAFHLSPGIAAAEPPVDPKRLPTTNKRSFASRLARVIVNCLIIFALVGAAIAWLQYTDDQTRAEIQNEAAKTWDLATGWLLSALHIDTRSGSDVASTPTPEDTNEASIQATPQGAAGRLAPAVAQPTLAPTQAAAQPTLAAAPVQAPVASAISPELQRKFDALQDNIADLQRMVERIASRQEQMTQDMMTLQTTQQSLAQKLATTTQAAAAPPPPHAKKLPYPEVSAAPRPVPSPPPRLGTSTSH